MNLDTANYEDAFRSEAEALAEVRDAVTRFGRALAALWALGYRDERGDLHAVAEGDARIELALSATTTA